MMNRRCRGFTLVGVLVYFTISTILSGLCFTSYYYITRAKHAQDEYLDAVRQAVIFGELFKNDIRKAGSARTDQTGRKSIINLGDGTGTAVYMNENGGIARIIRKNGREIRTAFLEHAVILKTGISIGTDRITSDLQISVRTQQREIRAEHVMLFTEILGYEE